MSNIMSTISDGIEKVTNDVTTVVEAALPVLAELSFEYALQLTFEALFAAL